MRIQAALEAKVLYIAMFSLEDIYIPELTRRCINLALGEKYSTKKEIVTHD